MTRYRKIPTEIDAMQFTGDNIHQIMTFVEEKTGCHNSKVLEYSPEDNIFYVRSPEGDMQLLPGSFLIRGIEGEFYPCKESVFWKTYEPVEG